MATKIISDIRKAKLHKLTNVFLKKGKRTLVLKLSSKQGKYTPFSTPRREALLRTKGLRAPA